MFKSVSPVTYLSQHHATINNIVSQLYDFNRYLRYDSNNNIFPFSALTLLVGRQEGHPACKKNWVLVCWWWWFDWSFARLTAPVVQLSPPLPSSSAPTKPANPGSRGKMAVKTHRERENSDSNRFYNNGAHIPQVPSCICIQWQTNM